MTEFGETIYLVEIHTFNFCSIKELKLKKDHFGLEIYEGVGCYFHKSDIEGMGMRHEYNKYIQFFFNDIDSIRELIEKVDYFIFEKLL